MKIEEAREGIGRTVIYDDGHGVRENGVIDSVGRHTVFVRYGAKTRNQGTNPEDLTFEIDMQPVGWKPTGADPAAEKNEFYAPPKGPDLGDPQADLPFTIRIQPPWTWERRMDPLTPRAVKVDVPGDTGFAVWIAFDPDGRLDEDVQRHAWRSHDSVRDWPIQHFLGVTAAMHFLEAPKVVEGPSVDDREIEGDMGVEAFRG